MHRFLTSVGLVCLLVFFSCFGCKAVTPKKFDHGWWPCVLDQLVLVCEQKLITLWCTQRNGQTEEKMGFEYLHEQQQQQNPTIRLVKKEDHIQNEISCKYNIVIS